MLASTQHQHDDEVLARGALEVLDDGGVLGQAPPPVHELGPGPDVLALASDLLPHGQHLQAYIGAPGERDVIASRLANEPSGPDV